MRRGREQALYDPAVVREILAAGVVAHVAVAGPDGAPRVVPMSYGRAGDHVYLHGSVASRLMRALRDGADACVGVTVVDGVVLARSAFHTSMNYRAVVVHGRAEEVTDPDERLAGLRAIMEQVAPGRWEEVRPPTDAEWRQTTVLRLPLTEASAKVRAGGPNDDAGDLCLPQWAGVIPLHTTSGPPEPDGTFPPDVGPPPPRG